MSDLSKAITQLRRSKGWDQGDLARYCGVSQATVSRWEKGSSPKGELLVKLSELAGVPINLFLDTNFTPVKISHSGMVNIPIVGTVEAGVWRESSQFISDEVQNIEVAPSDYPVSQRFGLRVEGYSMDRIFPPGTILECLKIDSGSGSIEPKMGHLVIAQRQRGDLFETTCKRLHRLSNGDYELHAESTRPEFATPIHIGKPSSDHHWDGEIKVIAVVVRSHQIHI